MSHIYVASSLENAPAVEEAYAKLEAAGHVITYKWTEHGAVFEKGLRALQDVALKERAALLMSTVVIVLLPGGRGTHFEMGFFHGYIKGLERLHPYCPRQLIIVGGPSDFEATRETCAFYHLPDIARVASIEEVIAAYDPKTPSMGPRVHGPICYRGKINSGFVCMRAPHRDPWHVDHYAMAERHVWRAERYPEADVAPREVAP